MSFNRCHHNNKVKWYWNRRKHEMFLKHPFWLRAYHLCDFTPFNIFMNFIFKIVFSSTNRKNFPCNCTQQVEKKKFFFLWMLLTIFGECQRFYFWFTNVGRRKKKEKKIKRKEKWWKSSCGWIMSENHFNAWIAHDANLPCSYDFHG